MTYVGSIPACAGEPHPGSQSSGKAGVYPRVCGGTDDTLGAEGEQRGLSPRVRGNRSRNHRRTESWRSIPACAGEPGVGTDRVPLATVYPRVCGGTKKRRQTMGCGEGLSPRVRGNLTRAQPLTGLLRSIPACAGEPAPSENQK